MSHNNLNSVKALNEIRILIKENKLLKGNKLPNERLLSSVINCNRSYIRNALLILEREGLVSRKIGSGTFVGTNATINPYVNVTAGCVIGSGSVLVKDCLVEGVYCGNPAKLIGWACLCGKKISKKKINSHYCSNCKS